jgi:hypothetical protein
MTLLLTSVIRTIEEAGLAYRGAFHPEPQDAVPDVRAGVTAGTVLLVGMVGHGQWPVFAQSSEATDGLPHPLDRWGRRLLREIANTFAARALEPSAGPPWWPFQRWAQRAESLHASPLGLLIHPQFGLWHSYRGALVLAERLTLPAPVSSASPCSTCTTQACLHTCPVSAFEPGQFYSSRCDLHLRASPQGHCRRQGCAARLACPVGRDHAHTPAQAQFHMAAFLRSRDEGNRG